LRLNDTPNAISCNTWSLFLKCPTKLGSFLEKRPSNLGNLHMMAYGVATMRRIPNLTGVFCKRALHTFGQDLHTKLSEGLFCKRALLVGLETKCCVAVCCSVALYNRIVYRTATLCITLHTAPPGNTLQHLATHCKHCITL